MEIPNTIYALFTSCFTRRHLNKRVLPNNWKFVRHYPSQIGRKSLFTFRSDAVRKFRIQNNPEPRNVLLLRKKGSSKGVYATCKIFIRCRLFQCVTVFSGILPNIKIITLILRRSRTGTVWFYTSSSNKRTARPKLYTKSLTRDLKLMYSRFTLVRISINL